MAMEFKASSEDIGRNLQRTPARERGHEGGSARRREARVELLSVGWRFATAALTDAVPVRRTLRMHARRTRLHRGTGAAARDRPLERCENEWAYYTGARGTR